MENEQFYEQVAAEIAAKEFKPGLWTVAFSEAAGDEGVARSLYIKLRVAQLVEARKRLAVRNTEKRIGQVLLAAAFVAAVIGALTGSGGAWFIAVLAAIIGSSLALK